MVRRHRKNLCKCEQAQGKCKHERKALCSVGSLCAFGRRAALTAVAGLAVACGGGGSSVTPPGPTPPPPPPQLVQRISSDTFTNATSQHATEVEPAAFTHGATVVTAFQAGRFFAAGASDIGFATSLDGGNTWTSGVLPGLTNIVSPTSTNMSASDTAVAFDAAHHVWLIVSLPIPVANFTSAALVSRSNDGVVWTNPVLVAPGPNASDKTWITCDDAATSPFFGHCYVEWDDPSAGGVIHVSTSTDGGASWGPPQSTVGMGTGLNGQPVVQPNGTVIVPMDDFNEQTVLAFASHDGGATWTQPSVVSPIVDHFEAGGLRSGPLVSAAVDASGIVYAVWQDCRFRAGCAENDLVLSTSHDGVGWSAPMRIPIDPTTSSIDHFIPGLAVDPSTSGGGAHLAVTYYYYANTTCTQANCQLFAGAVSSLDGGATWSAPRTLTGPMSLGWLAQTSQGLMVGDYIASTFASGRPIAVFASANAPVGNRFDEATYASLPGIVVARGPMRSSAGDHPVPGVVRDPGPRPRPR